MLTNRRPPKDSAYQEAMPHEGNAPSSPAQTGVSDVIDTTMNTLRKAAEVLSGVSQGIRFAPSDEEKLDSGNNDLLHRATENQRLAEQVLSLAKDIQSGLALPE